MISNYIRTRLYTRVLNRLDAGRSWGLLNDMLIWFVEIPLRYRNARTDYHCRRRKKLLSCGNSDAECQGCIVTLMN
jgi:hypothetical protein